MAERAPLPHMLQKAPRQIGQNCLKGTLDPGFLALARRVLFGPTCWAFPSL
jgi:hypothetical protein